MAMPLMKQAAAKQAPAPEAGTFKRPDLSQMIPAEIKDVVARVHAAGLRVITSPGMREEVMAAVQSQDPIPQTLAQNVTGLLLTLDQKAAEAGGGQGIPPAALFPAGMELLGEAADVMVAAGKPVSQDDFNTAAMMMYGMVGEKLGLSQDELMQGAAQAAPGDAEDEGPAETQAEGGNENEPVHGGGPDMENEPVEEPPEADDEQPGTETVPPPGRRPLMGRTA